MSEENTNQPVKEVDPQFVNDIELVADVANHLARNNLDFKQVIASMLAARQLYGMCLFELDWLCHYTDFSKIYDDQATVAAEAMTAQQQVMFKEVLISAAAMQAQQPFDEKVLFDGMTNTVFPWMQTIVAKHSAWQNAEKEKLNEKE